MSCFVVTRCLDTLERFGGSIPNCPDHNDAVDADDMDGDGKPEIAIACSRDSALLSADGNSPLAQTTPTLPARGNRSVRAGRPGKTGRVCRSSQ